MILQGCFLSISASYYDRLLDGRRRGGHRVRNAVRVRKSTSLRRGKIYT